MEYEIIYYKDNTSQVVKSDLDLLNNTKLTDISFDQDEERKLNFYVQKNFFLSKLFKDPLKAVTVKFNLPSSCYATMALRELMKLDTSKDYQTSLNK